VLMRVFVGGAMQPELCELEDDEVTHLVRSELGALLGASGEPLLVDVSRHCRAMPQYTLGHLERIAEIRRLAARHPRLILTGNAFAGVGIPDVIRNATSAAEAALRALFAPAATAAA